MLKKLLGYFHRHSWEDTLINGFFIPVEQKCSCGKWRHHLLQDIHGFQTSWRDGKHPDFKLN